MHALPEFGIILVIEEVDTHADLEFLLVRTHQGKKYHNPKCLISLFAKFCLLIYFWQFSR